MLEFGGMKLYDVQDLAKMLDLHEKTVRALIRRNDLKGKKLAKKWYVSEDNLRLYFESEQPKVS